MRRALQFFVMDTQVVRDWKRCMQTGRAIARNPALDSFEQVIEMAAVARADGIAASPARVNALGTLMAVVIGRVMPEEQATADNLFRRARAAQRRVDQGDTSVLCECYQVTTSLFALAARMDASATCPRANVNAFACIAQPLIMLPLVMFCADRLQQLHQQRQQQQQQQ